MRLTLGFEPGAGTAILDGQFPRHFQAAIYQALDPKLAERVHNEGFSVSNRAFRLMVFSDVAFRERPIREAGGLRFSGPASIVIASPFREIIDSLATSLLMSGRFRLGNHVFNVTHVKAEDTKVEAERVDVRTLSPVVVYSTFLRADGRKYTCYFQPGETDFERLVAENLARKYQAVHGKEPPGRLHVYVRRVGRMVIRNFKGTVVKGWHCALSLAGPADLLKLALDAGIGSKNAQGWGCVEIIEAPSPLEAAVRR